MCYQEALPNFGVHLMWDSLVTIGDRHWQKLAATFQKANQQIHLRLHGNGHLFFNVGCLFCMGAYKSDSVVVIKMGAYVHWVHILLGAHYPNFTVFPKS